MQEQFIWTEEAIIYLASHMATTPVAAMARHLETTAGEVNAQMACTGFSKGGKIITSDAILERARAFKTVRGYYPRSRFTRGSGSGWHADDAELCRALSLPSQSTVARRFGNMSRAWAAAEGLPLELADIRAKKISRETALDYLNIYHHLTGRWPQATEPSANHGRSRLARRWNDMGLSARLMMPLPGRYRQWFEGLTAACRLAAQLPLNTDLLAALDVADDEVRILGRFKSAHHQALHERSLAASAPVSVSSSPRRRRQAS